LSITHNDTKQSVGLLWTRDRPVAETSTWQHTTFTKDRHPWPLPDEVRTRNPSKRAAADPRFRPLSHWNQRTFPLPSVNTILIIFYLPPHICITLGL
jgi:hypothetical protein